MAEKRNNGYVPSFEEEKLENEELIYELAQLYKVFGDETRLRILRALLDGEKPVGVLSEDLSMTMSAVSHSLRILKAARLVSCRREGKAVYYALCDDHVKMILLLGLDHVSE
ncbi:MAG: winged helix-turn-helix transcriptional regulator [Clostridia bacterium]|nr:winged helix-turn-helix transcriptional regulator [Clostridia bacterium]